MRNPVPVSLEQLFQGRSNVSPEYRDAYEAGQNDSAKNVEVEDADSEEE